MKKTDKLTPWFFCKSEPPIRAGKYKIKSGITGVEWPELQKFTGRAWLFRTVAKDQWCGLTAPAKKAKA